MGSAGCRSLLAGDKDVRNPLIARKRAPTTEWRWAGRLGMAAHGVHGPPFGRDSTDDGRTPICVICVIRGKGLFGEGDTVSTIHLAGVGGGGMFAGWRKCLIKGRP